MPRKKSGTFDQSKYIQQFMKDKVTVKKVSFNKESEADMLEWLADKKFSTYVKELIRLDMEIPSRSCHIVYNRVKACHDCNDCGRSPCEYMPDPGETTRINCPLWESK